MFSPASHPSTVNSARKCSQIIARGLQGAAGTMESSSILQIETQQGWEMSPHTPTRSMCDGWPDQKLNTPWGPWRHIKATRAGQALGFCFFLSLPFSKHRKCATMTKCSGMFQFALNCITLQQEIRVSSAVPKEGPAYPPTVYTRYTSVSFGGGQVEK